MGRRRCGFACGRGASSCGTGNRSHEAGLGEQLTLNVDGTLDRQAVEIYGPHWDWVVQMAAVPEVEGKSLEMFLTWLAREGGWTFQYSDPRLAREAPNTIMRGDVQGLSALEAAELALGSSELRFRVTGQVLLIEPLDDP